MPARVIMLVDLDYFYAQVEERRNPSIKSKPVVVCVYSGRGEDSGAVATANYIARQSGVRSGIPISLAKKRLKDKADAVFLPMDRGHYEEVSSRIMGILRSHADIFEQVGIDEAYLDVSEKTNGDFESAAELSRTIKNDMMIHEEITCSIGVGPNKLVAKIASDVLKPDGLTVVRPHEVEDFLAPMPVGRIIGIGTKTTEKMGELGIKTVADLAKHDIQKLVGVFGKTMGMYFHNAALGIDESPVQEREEIESISRIATLKENTRDAGVILSKANQLAEQVHATLLERRLTFKNVGIVVIMTDLTTHSRSRTLENPTTQLEVIQRVAKDLFERFLGDSAGLARRVGVRVSGLEKERQAQKHITDFFTGDSRD